MIENRLEEVRYVILNQCLRSVYPSQIPLNLFQVQSQITLGITQRYLCYTIKPQITLFSLQWLSAGSAQLRKKIHKSIVTNAGGRCGDIYPQVYITI